MSIPWASTTVIDPGARWVFTIQTTSTTLPANNPSVSQCFPMKLKMFRIAVLALGTGRPGE